MHAQKQNTDKTHKNTRTTVCAHTDSGSHSYNHARTHAQQPNIKTQREGERVRGTFSLISFTYNALKL